MPSNVANFGITGNGKTFRTIMLQKEWSHLTPMVIDPYREYVLETQFKQIDPNCNILTVLSRIENTYLVVDESQLYIPTHKMKLEDQRNFILTISGCRHRNNYVIFNYSALSQCAFYLRECLNMIILGHTNDSIEQCDKFGDYLAPLMKEKFQMLQKIRTEKKIDKWEHAAIIIRNV